MLMGRTIVPKRTKRGVEERCKRDCGAGGSIPAREEKGAKGEWRKSGKKTGGKGGSLKEEGGKLKKGKSGQMVSHGNNTA